MAGGARRRPAQRSPSPWPTSWWSGRTRRRHQPLTDIVGKLVWPTWLSTRGFLSTDPVVICGQGWDLSLLPMPVCCPGSRGLAEEGARALCAPSQGRACQRTSIAHQAPPCPERGAREPGSPEECWAGLQPLYCTDHELAALPCCVPRLSALVLQVFPTFLLALTPAVPAPDPPSAWRVRLGCDVGALAQPQLAA